jgi:hypothetical protein
LVNETSCDISFLVLMITRRKHEARDTFELDLFVYLSVCTCGVRCWLLQLYEIFADYPPLHSAVVSDSPSISFYGKNIRLLQV